MSDIKPSMRGALHEELEISQDKKISLGTLMKAKERARRTGNGTLMKRTTYAINVRGK